MKPKTIKEKKQPKNPRLNDATIGAMIEWANSCALDKLPENKLELANEALTFSGKIELKKAQWSWRRWIGDYMHRVRQLPHTTTLGIRDMRKVSIPSGDRGKMEKAAKISGLKLHHVNFQYFTMP